jgi:bifunctional non-homologous end joining protein LigD
MPSVLLLRTRHSEQKRSTMGLELAKRQKLLTGILDEVGDDIQLLESFEVSLSKLADAANEIGFERMIAKPKDSVYDSGNRSRAWVKYKINKGQEFVGGG